MKNKRMLKIKYPKLMLLILTFVLAYILFTARDFSAIHNTLLTAGYFGTFLAGMLFAYGFTAAPATAVLMMLAKEQNILLAGFIGGFGALTGDLIIFKLIRHSFADEIEKLSKGNAANYLIARIPDFFKKYIVPVLAGFIIASPLPDEIGVSLLAASRAISTKVFSVLSYVLNTIGIFVVLLIGELI